MSLVSIIIPSYNYGWLLAETLDSLLAQTHQHWECLIVDDGSTDTTRAIAESYQAKDNRFRYLYQSNAGISAARNHGLRLALGEYIQFLDADDLLVPTKLAVQIEYLAKHPDVDVVYGDTRYFRHGEPGVLSRSHDMRDTPWVVEASGKGDELLLPLMRHNIMVTPAPLFKASLLEKVGFFAEELHSMEDWELWVRCVLAGACFHYNNSPQTWPLVRVHSGSTSQNFTRMLKYEVAARHRLRQVLADKNAIRAVALNETALNAIIKDISDRAQQKIIEGNWRTGIKDYLYLASTTGHYAFYIKILLYWLKQKAIHSEKIKG